MSRFARWRLRRAELHLADLHHHDEKWVSGWSLGRPPSQIARMKRRITKAEQRVRRLGGNPDE